jgi:hypothetical protein
MNPKRLMLIVVPLFFCFESLLRAYGQPAESVRWVAEKENAALWTTIRADFEDELQPDVPEKVAPVLAYSYKYIYRVAVHDDSALVIVGHLETKDSKYPGYYSAFNYDVQSHARTAIKGAEVVSLFRFVKFAGLDVAPPQDILFTWFTCTECEASQVLSAFHYDTGKRVWLLRTWQTNKDIWWTTAQGPVIWSDVSASDTISFDCLHGFLTSDGNSAFGIRCREVAESEKGKRTTTDIAAKYTFKGAESRLEIVKEEEKRKLSTELCAGSPGNKLCKSVPTPAGKQ